MCFNLAKLNKNVILNQICGLATCNATAKCLRRFSFPEIYQLICEKPMPIGEKPIKKFLN